MKLKSMKPAKIMTVEPPPVRLLPIDASRRPTAHPTKPKTCSLMRPSVSASSTAKTIPTMSSELVSAAPFAAITALAMTSVTLRALSALAPNAAAKMVGVKMPMP